MAKLMRDEDSLIIHASIYIVILDTCIDEFLGNNIDENIRQEAIEFYKNSEAKKSAENKKYHMYQY